VLLGLLLYAYATGVFSSRKIERVTYEAVPFRFIAGNLHPDHDTLATFRHMFLPELKDLFVQVLLLAQEAGVLTLGTISLDGTKIHADASKHRERASHVILMAVFTLWSAGHPSGCHHLSCSGQSDLHSPQMSSLHLWHSRAQGNRFWQTPPPPALCFPARSPGRCFWQKCTRVSASKLEQRTLGSSTLFRFRCADSFVVKLVNLLKTVLKKRYVP
jgi:hypothetical protein